MPHAPNTAVHVTLRTWPKVVRQQPKVVRQQPKVVYRGILGAEKVRPVSGLIQYVTLTKPIRFTLTNWSYIGLNGRKAFVLKTILSLREILVRRSDWRCDNCHFFALLVWRELVDRKRLDCSLR
jgi:hypothetical protein